MNIMNDCINPNILKPFPFDRGFGRIPTGKPPIIVYAAGKAIPHSSAQAMLAAAVIGGGIKLGRAIAAKRKSRR